MTAIQISDLTITYQQQTLFENFSVRFSANQWTTLLGASGVGKSTLLNAIAQLPTGGEIDPRSKITHQQSLSYMPQHHSLMPWLSALDNVLLGYALRQEITATIKEQAKSLLVDVGLEKAVQKKPNALSGGMKQRVALARTLLEDKPIVLMDEPFSALDTITRLNLQELAAKLLQNKTVILVTHDPLEALRLSHRVILLANHPVTIAKTIELNSPIPRAIDDTDILKQQQNLLNQLKAAATC